MASESSNFDKAAVFIGAVVMAILAWLCPVFMVGMLVGAVLYAVSLPDPEDDSQDEDCEIEDDGSARDVNN